MKNTFILSDESVNSYGLIVKTDGIDMKRFLKNPIMLYSHDVNIPIGIWENLRISNNQLLADAKFSDDETAKNIEKKVNDGFIRGCSVAIDIIETEGNIITRSKLVEASVCAIPSNENAVKLTYRNNQIVSFSHLIQLQCEFDYNKRMEQNKVLFDMRLLLQKAIDIEVVNETEKNAYESLLINDKTAFKSLLNSKIESNKKQCEQITFDAYSSGKFSSIEDVRLLASIGEKIGSTSLQKIINLIPDRLTLSKFINIANNEPIKDVNWYRKNSPETLEENPEFYKQLIENKKQTQTF